MLAWYHLTRGGMVGWWRWTYRSTSLASAHCLVYTQRFASSSSRFTSENFHIRLLSCLLRCSLRLNARAQNWHWYRFAGAVVGFFEDAAVVVVASDGILYDRKKFQAANRDTIRATTKWSLQCKCFEVRVGLKWKGRVCWICRTDHAGFFDDLIAQLKGSMWFMNHFASYRFSSLDVRTATMLWIDEFDAVWLCWWEGLKRNQEITRYRFIQTVRNREWAPAKEGSASYRTAHLLGMVGLNSRLRFAFRNEDTPGLARNLQVAQMNPTRSMFLGFFASFHEIECNGGSTACVESWHESRWWADKSVDWYLNIQLRACQSNQVITPIKFQAQPHVEWGVDPSPSRSRGVVPIMPFLPCHNSECFLLSTWTFQISQATNTSSVVYHTKVMLINS